MSIPRLPDWLLWLGLSLASVTAASAAPPAADATARARLARDRAAVDREAQAAQKACAQEFAVTDCVDRVKADRRLGIQPLDRELAQLDDEARKRRAADRVAQIQQRQAAMANVRPEVSVRTRKPAASEPMPVQTPPARSAQATVEARAAATSQAEADASRRAGASALRAEQAQAHRKAVEERNRERAKKSRPAEPLPLPASPAASR